MSLDEFMIIIRESMSNGNKSLSGHFERGLVRVQELISNFQRSKVCLDVGNMSEIREKINVICNFVII